MGMRVLPDIISLRQAFSRAFVRRLPIEFYYDGSKRQATACGGPHGQKLVGPRPGGHAAQAQGRLQVPVPWLPISWVVTFVNPPRRPKLQRFPHID